MLFSIQIVLIKKYTTISHRGTVKYEHAESPTSTLHDRQRLD